MHRPRTLTAALLALILIQPPQPAAAQEPAANVATPTAVPPAPGGVPGPAVAPKPFKDVIKDAKETPGFFTLYQKDEKVWLAIAPDQLDKPFFFSYNIPKSIGERGLYASQMGNSHLVVFRKIGNQIQLIARNTRFFAQAGTPQSRFVAESFSDSLLASAAAASTPHPDSKAVLVEINSLLFADIPGYLTRLETAFRMPFVLDTKNSSIARVDNTQDLTGVQVQAHFNVPKVAAPPLTPPTPPTPAPPPPPQTTPDPRSLFVSFYYNFARLPETPMATRVADERVGHFVTSRDDYTEDTAPKTRVHHVNRWRLEKKDPAAALSEPREAITYWIDKNVPEKYRKAVADGILEWNKAFEKVGIQNAILVRQQTDQDNFNTMDARHASVRWFTGADVGFAIGPSRVDPRSGEILDADIGMSDVFARGARRLVAEDLGKPLAFDASPAGTADPRQQSLFLSCNYAAESAHDMHFAIDLLEARGLTMDGPDAEKLAQDYVKDVVMHEVGHTLGLRHNFRSSTVYTLKQIQDPAFTKVHGLTGSVMDYNPFNLATKNETQGEYVMSTL
ncbi:MAG: zinc-dependent metalloprotease, partial [Sterolibacterium sp.]